MEEEERQKCIQLITMKLVSLTAGCLVLLFLWFYIIPKIFSSLGTDRTFLAPLVFVAGLVGGFVSIQQRLPTVRLTELRELSKSWISILLIPINGGIFALVLMLLFLSGILKGSLFPEYNESNLSEGFLNWSRNAIPTTGTGIAKLLFWSFAAGFSERFVPQIIRKTTEKANSK
jgi:hypothetical protein